MFAVLIITVLARLALPSQVQIRLCGLFSRLHRSSADQLSFLVQRLTGARVTWTYSLNGLPRDLRLVIGWNLARVTAMTSILVDEGRSRGSLLSLFEASSGASPVTFWHFGTCLTAGQSCEEEEDWRRCYRERRAILFLVLRHSGMPNVCSICCSSSDLPMCQRCTVQVCRGRLGPCKKNCCCGWSWTSWSGVLNMDMINPFSASFNHAGMHFRPFGKAVGFQSDIADQVQPYSSPSQSSLTSELDEVDGMLIDFDSSSPFDCTGPTLAALHEKDRQSPIIDEDMQRGFHDWQLSQSWGSASSMSSSVSFDTERSGPISPQLRTTATVLRAGHSGIQERVQAAGPSPPSNDVQGRLLALQSALLHERQLQFLAMQDPQQNLASSSAPALSTQVQSGQFSCFPARPSEKSSEVSRSLSFDQLAQNVARLANLTAPYQQRPAPSAALPPMPMEQSSPVDSSTRTIRARRAQSASIAIHAPASARSVRRSSVSRSRARQSSKLASSLGDGGSASDIPDMDSSDDSENDESSDNPAAPGERRRRRTRSFSADPSPIRLLTIDGDINRLSCIVTAGDDDKSRREKNKLASR